MPQSRQPVTEARRDHLFLVIEPAEVGRLWRFAELGLFHSEIAQPARRNEEGVDRLLGVGIDQRRAPDFAQARP